MLFSGTFARRAVAGAVGSGSVALATLFGAPSAMASPTPPPPNCMAADYANASGRVALATSGYLATHPDANLFFSSLRDERSHEQRQRVVDYFNAHPQVHDELTAIRQPLTDLENRCGFNDNDPSALYSYPG